jgi:hypothetical protein
MSRQTTPRQKFKTVSEWHNAGGIKTDYRHVSGTIAERDGKPARTAKAIGLRALKTLDSGKQVNAVAWFPLSYCQEVTDDYYQQTAPANLIVPEWLLRAKHDEGFRIL